MECYEIFYRQFLPYEYTISKLNSQTKINIYYKNDRANRDTENVSEDQ